MVATCIELCDSQDWEGALELESRFIAIANKRENSNPALAGSINWMLGGAHKEMGREGGIQQASLYYKKYVEIAKKAGNKVMISEGVLSLAECYVKYGRVEEAMDLHKSLCDEIGKESLDTKAILEFAGMLQDHLENSRALEILEHNVDTIEISWEKQEQCRAYGLIASLYCFMNDFAKSNVYYERQLSIAKETNNAESEAEALNGIGRNYGSMSDYDSGMEYLEQALVIEYELGGDRIGKTYCTMGEVLVAQEGREKDAILMFQKCVGLYEQGDGALMGVFLGQAYTKIEAWDDAIASLEECVSITESIADFIEDERIGDKLKGTVELSLGNTYLEKYVSFPERNDEVIRKALFWSEAAFNLQNLKEGVNLSLYLDLAQEHYFLGDTEKAHLMLKEYLDGSLRLGSLFCQACYQTCAKGAIMEKCSVCKVARYCSQAHSVHAWKKGRLCHKVMCPWLKRCRKITEGKYSTTDVCDELFNDFFERVLASKPK